MTRHGPARNRPPAPCDTAFPQPRSAGFARGARRRGESDRRAATGGPGRGGLSRRNTRDDRGITTAEYAVGTAAGAGLAGLLYKLLTGGFGDQLLKTLFDHVLGLLGIG